ncbi:MAG: macro domain-containing protein, partial [Planctomycetota bacterium]
NLFWRSSETSVRDSVRNAVSLAARHGYRSIAIPLIGAGSGGSAPDKVQAIMEDELAKTSFAGDVRIVRYRPKSKSG